MTKLTALRVLGALALVGSLLGVAPAAASVGSVPDVVAEYADGRSGLIADLDDLFGIGADGKGIDFNDTTRVAQLHRAWFFTPDFLEGAPVAGPEDAVRLVNLWVAPISIFEKPFGVASIWINPANGAPEIADFSRDPAAASMLTEMDDEAVLVRDVDRDAWFALDGSDLTPLVPGSSGLAGPSVLSVYQGMLQRAAQSTEAPEVVNTDPFPALALVFWALVVVAGLALAWHWRAITDPEWVPVAVLAAPSPMVSFYGSTWIDPDLSFAPRTRKG